jgi:hypothetical protein
MAVEHCHDAGFDELGFIPLTDDLGELDRLEAALHGLRAKTTDALRPSAY